MGLSGLVWIPDRFVNVLLWININTFWWVCFKFVLLCVCIYIHQEGRREGRKMRQVFLQKLPGCLARNLISTQRSCWKSWYKCIPFLESLFFPLLCCLFSLSVSCSNFTEEQPVFSMFLCLCCCVCVQVDVCNWYGIRFCLCIGDVFDDDVLCLHPCVCVCEHKLYACICV